jgi:hypothetical protein
MTVMLQKRLSFVPIVLTCVVVIIMPVSPFIQNSSAQTWEVQPKILIKPILNGKVTVLELGLHFATTIQMPEPVSSVVVGDPTLFKVEHSDKEPKLVFIKPLSSEAAQSNLLVSTIGGHSISFLVRSNRQVFPVDPDHKMNSPRPVHFLMEWKSTGGFVIDDTAIPSVLIPETASVTASTLNRRANVAEGTESPERRSHRISHLLEEQKRCGLPSLEGTYFRVGISRIYEEGNQPYVLFSAVNQSDRTLELLPPQVQLAGRLRKKKFSASSEQLPVLQFRLSRNKLRPGERADGVIQFERPAFKQSYESYLLQIAESAAVDLPVLIPIRLGMSGNERQKNER